MARKIKNILAVVIPILFGLAVQVTWPQVSPVEIWSIVALAVFLWFAAHYLESIANHFLGKSEKKPRDLIPLADGVDMAWSELKREIIMLRGDDWSGHDITQYFTGKMFSGHSSSINLYATNEHFKTPQIINESHIYAFNDDMETAENPWNGDTLTNLKVRRRDVKAWVENYLNGQDEE